MSVDITFYAAPAEGRDLDRAALRALLVDLIAHEIVDRPCALACAAGLDAEDPMHVDLDIRVGRKVVYAGGSSQELLGSLDALRPGKRDLVVRFERFAVARNEALAAALYANGERGGVHVYAFAKPRELEIVDLYAEDEAEAESTLTTQVCFVAFGGGGPAALADVPPLAEVLTRHFGPDLRVAVACA